jgi:hypothetical protein
LWYYLKHHVHPDFYWTEQNKRVFVTEFKYLIKLLKQSHTILISRNGDVNGIIMIWKGQGGDVKRNYIKINGENNRIINNLISVLLWNFEKDLYIKIKKYSDYINVFREKNFIFAGGRGREILLKYKKRENK